MQCYRMDRKASANKIRWIFMKLEKETALYNKNAIKFYENKGYHPRMYTEIKKIN